MYQIKFPLQVFKAFATELRDQIEIRFSNCGSDEEVNRFANYLDPAFKGIHIEVLGSLNCTKEAILLKWGDMRDVTQEVGEVEDITRQDPTAMLLKTRNRSGEEGVGLTKIQKEMVAYEALEELPSNKARLSWWKDKEQMLPLLAGVAKGILGLP